MIRAQFPFLDGKRPPLMRFRLLVGPFGTIQPSQIILDAGHRRAVRAADSLLDRQRLPEQGLRRGMAPCGVVDGAQVVADRRRIACLTGSSLFQRLQRPLVGLLSLRVTRLDNVQPGEVAQSDHTAARPHRALVVAFRLRVAPLRTLDQAQGAQRSRQIRGPARWAVLLVHLQGLQQQRFGLRVVALPIIRNAPVRQAGGRLSLFQCRTSPSRRSGQ